MRLGDARALRQIEVIPTGSLAMDLALGVGGIPRGPRGRDFRPRILGQDDADAARDRQRPKRLVGWPRSSMPNTRWTQATRNGWE